MTEDSLTNQAWQLVETQHKSFNLGKTEGNKSCKREMNGNSIIEKTGGGSLPKYLEDAVVPKSRMWNSGFKLWDGRFLAS